MVAAKKDQKKAVPGPSYQDMIKDAIVALKERSGSSRPSLKKYIKANNNITVADNMFDNFFNKALKAGVEKGEFVQPKGPSGTTKLAPKVAKPAGEKKPAVSKKATPAKKSTAANTKKSITKAPKKTTAKAATKPAVKKSSTKVAAKPTKPVAKAAAKPAAKSAPRKKSVAAPAVVEKKTVLSKTKSGRVTKTTAKSPAVKKAAARAPAKKVKKATPTKA